MHCLRLQFLSNIGFMDQRNSFSIYHSDALKGKDGHAKEERVVLGLADVGQVKGVLNVLETRKRCDQKGSGIIYINLFCHYQFHFSEKKDILQF